MLNSPICERNNSRRAFVDKTFQYWWKSVPFCSQNFLFKSPEHIRPIYQHWEQRFKFFNPKFLKILPAQSFGRLRKDFCINLTFLLLYFVFCFLYIVASLRLAAVHNDRMTQYTDFNFFAQIRPVLVNFELVANRMCILRVGISPSNDFNLSYKLTGRGRVSDIGKQQGFLIQTQKLSKIYFFVTSIISFPLFTFH